MGRDFLWHSPLIREKSKFLGLHKFVVSLQACLAEPVVQNGLPYKTSRLRILLHFIFLLLSAAILSDKETLSFPCIVMEVKEDLSFLLAWREVRERRMKVEKLLWPPA